MTYANSYQPLFPTMSNQTNQTKPTKMSKSTKPTKQTKPKMLNIPNLQNLLLDKKRLEDLDAVQQSLNHIGVKEGNSINEYASKFIVTIAMHYDVINKGGIHLLDFRSPIDALNFLEEFYTTHKSNFSCFRLHYLINLNGRDEVTNLIIETSLKQLIKFATKDKHE